jgi:hypothetical protein
MAGLSTTMKQQNGGIRFRTENIRSELDPSACQTNGRGLYLNFVFDRSRIT